MANWTIGSHEEVADRAVSPVIGVILMVAITVILAAVIGTFVLDLGQSAGQSAPQASLSVDTNVNANEVTIEHTGGDGIDSQQTRVIVTEDNSGNSLEWSESSSSSVLGVGGSVTIDTNSNTVSGWGYSSGTGTAFSIDKGDKITVQLIDVESQRVIFETTVTA